MWKTVSSHALIACAMSYPSARHHVAALVAWRDNNPGRLDLYERNLAAAGGRIPVRYAPDQLQDMIGTEMLDRVIVGKECTETASLLTLAGQLDRKAGERDRDQERAENTNDDPAEALSREELNGNTDASLTTPRVHTSRSRPTWKGLASPPAAEGSPRCRSRGRHSSQHGHGDQDRQAGQGRQPQ
jgi:hypothetical protein